MTFDEKLSVLKNYDTKAAIERGRKAIQAERAKGPSDNSALTWFPPIEKAGLPVPRTIFVPFEPEQLWPMLDGMAAIGFPWRALRMACKAFGYPVFLRTDRSSAKHMGPEAYKPMSEEDLRRCVYLTFEDNALKDLASFCRAFMVREWLDLDGTFTAFDGHLISREFRLFADMDGVLCEHFYWPEEAIKGNTKCRDWKKKLAFLSRSLDGRYHAKLHEMARAAVRAIGHGEWSVDFAQDKAGKWWLTDMASARDSWHTEHKGH